MPANEFLPKTNCSSELRALVEKALAEERKTYQQLSLSDWIRAAVREKINRETSARRIAAAAKMPQMPRPQVLAQHDEWLPKVRIGEKEREALERAVTCMQAAGRPCNVSEFYRFAVAEKARKATLKG